jgi:nucleotide-binding universal stress UspA family protein
MIAMADNQKHIKAVDRPEPVKTPAVARPLRVLAVVDGSERSGRVVKYLLGLAAQCGAIEVVLLNIQPKPQEWRMRGYGWFQREAIHDRLINDLGGRIVASAGRHFEAAGVAHSARVELGGRVETIVRCAREENCDLLVLAEAPPGAVRRWLMRSAGLSFGSVASVAIHSMRVPLVVIA